jgi:membrane protein DedA with SNARE-associated domain
MRGALPAALAQVKFRRATEPKAAMHILHALHHFVSDYGYVAVFVLVALESAGVPMPGETALVTAAVLAGRGDLHIALVIACGAAAAILGDNAGYWVGREFGFPLIYRYGRYIRVDEARLKLAQYLFQRHGGKIVFFGRFVAVLRAFAAFLAGVNHLPWPRFLVFNALGGIVWATIFGLGGYFLGQAFEHYARPVGVTALVVALIGAVAASRFIAHHEKLLLAKAEAALPGPLVAPQSR